jgi:RHS repeat-associated protein
VTQRDAFGNALQAQNIDGVATVSAADFMGRPFISRTATGAWTKTLHFTGVGSACPSGYTAFYTLTTGGGQPSQYQCFDKLGREVRTATQGFAGTLIEVDTRYDALGRVARVSEPYFAGATAYWNDTAYDALGRTSAVQAADGNDLTYDYDTSASLCAQPGAAHQTLTINGLGQSQLEVRSALGEALKVIDNACGVVGYDYDAVGNLTLVTGADGAQTVMTYDLAGRKTSLSDPDKGNWQYAYNALGELTRQRDGKSQALDFVYDLLGRVTTRYERSGVSSLFDTTYTTVNSETTAWINSTAASVKGKSQPQSIIYRAGTTGAIVQQQTLSYDSFGRLSQRTTAQDALTLTEETTYDQFGRVFQQFDGSGDSRGIRYHYNARGYVEKLQEAREGAQGVLYQHIQSQDQRGNVTYMILGNGVEAFAQYAAPTGRLQTLEAYDVNGVELQRVDYTFDVLGNLQGRHDTSQSQNLDETYRYDLLNRLETVLLSTNGAAAQTKLALQYDTAGNVTSKSDVGSYLYGAGSAGPHAVTSAGGITYSYDANGNQISSSDGRTITYSLFDQAKLIQKGTEKTEFVYGAGNQRIKRVDDNIVEESRITWYFGSVERIEQNGQNAFFKRSLGGVAIADYFPATGNQSVLYLVKDHLGSIHSTVNESGLVSGSTAMNFGPFGERRNTTWSGPLAIVFQKLQNFKTTRGFTGHEHADGLGIIHMNGRIYDPKLGRFLQADPFVQAPKNSQSLNRYSYVLNNPLSYTDPSGYFSLKSLWKKVRPFAAIGLSIWMPGSTAIFGNLAGGFFAAATTGFVAGYVASGSLTGAVAGAFSAAAFYGIGSSFEQLAGSGAWGGSGLSGEAFAVKSILHGAAGGILALGTGGKFGHGFISAGLTQVFSGRIGGLRSSFGRIAAAAALGGTSSAITGGKFANGALTGAFSRAFNEELDHRVARHPDRRRPGLYITGHKILKAGPQHLAIEFVPAGGSSPIWISAGPLGATVFEGAQLLVSDVGRESDFPLDNFSVDFVAPPAGQSFRQYFDTLLLLDSAYCDCVDYDALPGVSNGFNSNSYVRSLIYHSGGSTLSSLDSFFGGSQIIPRRYFGLED